MMNWINKKRNKKGFTLVELVVVIAILGILAAIAVPRFTDVTASAAIGAAEANHRTLASAILMAQTQEGGNLPAVDGDDGMGNLVKYIQGGASTLVMEGVKYKWEISTAEGTKGEGTLTTTITKTSGKYVGGTSKGNIAIDTTTTKGSTIFTTTFQPSN